MLFRSSAASTLFAWFGRRQTNRERVTTRARAIRARSVSSRVVRPHFDPPKRCESFWSVCSLIHCTGPILTFALVPFARAPEAERALEGKSQGRPSSPVSVFLDSSLRMRVHLHTCRGRLGSLLSHDVPSTWRQRSLQKCAPFRRRFTGISALQVLQNRFHIENPSSFKVASNFRRVFAPDSFLRNQSFNNLQFLKSRFGTKT